MRRIVLIVGAFINLAFPYAGTYVVRGAALPHLIGAALFACAVAIADITGPFASGAGLTLIIISLVAAAAMMIHSIYLLVKGPTAPESRPLRVGIAAMIILAMLALWAAMGFKP